MHEPVHKGMSAFQDFLIARQTGRAGREGRPMSRDISRLATILCLIAPSTIFV
jgi:hypothetical protein